jgi:hypothetical protein
MVQAVGGFKIGLTSTDLKGDNDGTALSKWSGVIGGIWGWELAPWFTLQVEPVWTQKGVDLEAFRIGELPTSLKLDYVELPILAKFKMRRPSDSRSGPFAVVGPAPAVATNAELRVQGADENAAEYITDFDLGVAMGLGYDIAVDQGVLTLEARYVWGVLETFESNAPRPEVTNDLMNRAWQFTVGWYTPVF